MPRTVTRPKLIDTETYAQTARFMMAISMRHGDYGLRGKALKRMHNAIVHAWHREQATAQPFTLRDDGTLDTVLVCMGCGHEERFNYDESKSEGDTPGSYDNFVFWAKDEAMTWHQCGSHSSSWTPAC